MKGLTPALRDALMIRYSAAHPAAEQEIFPHLAAVERGPLSVEEDSWMRAIGRVLHG